MKGTKNARTFRRSLREISRNLAGKRWSVDCKTLLQSDKLPFLQRKLEPKRTLLGFTSVHRRILDLHTQKRLMASIHDPSVPRSPWKKRYAFYPTTYVRIFNHTLIRRVMAVICRWKLFNLLGDLMARKWRLIVASSWGSLKDRVWKRWYHILWFITAHFLRVLTNRPKCILFCAWNLPMTDDRRYSETVLMFLPVRPEICWVFTFWNKLHFAKKHEFF